LAGKLVHIDCPITRVPTLTDSDFGVSAQTLGLRRRVEAYQWVQHEHKRCWKDDPNAQEERCEVTYSYSTEWRDSHQASHTFNQPQGHSNPAWSVHASAQRAAEAFAGGYRLPSDLAARLTREVDLVFTDPSVACASWAAQGGPAEPCPWSSTGSGLYYRAAPGSGPLGSAPAVGDVRVSWSRVLADRVSVLAQQTSGQAGLGPYVARSGKALQLFSEGSVGAEALLSASEASNRFWTWALRALFTYLNWTALCWVFRPLSVAVDVLPLIGHFVSDVAALGISLARRRAPAPPRARARARAPHSRPRAGGAPHLCARLQPHRRNRMGRRAAGGGAAAAPGGAGRGGQPGGGSRQGAAAAGRGGACGEGGGLGEHARAVFIRVFKGRLMVPASLRERTCAGVTAPRKPPYETDPAPGSLYMCLNASTRFSSLVLAVWRLKQCGAGQRLRPRCVRHSRGAQRKPGAPRRSPAAPLRPLTRRAALGRR